MSNKITELKLDITELDSLEKQAVRQKVKDILSIEKRKLVSEVVKLEQENSTQVPNTPVSTGASSSNTKYEAKLNNYAWDQTNKFVKFYVTLEKVHTILPENIKCEFTNKSVELKVKDLENKDYVFKISNLLHFIDPQNSSWRVKTDMVIISAAKVEQINWSHVTEWEKKASDTQKLDKDTNSMDNSDPTAGLMSLMKNMYDKGDDEMKRTIAKAWTESQNKGLGGPAF